MKISEEKITRESLNGFVGSYIEKNSRQLGLKYDWNYWKIIKNKKRRDLIFWFDVEVIDVGDNFLIVKDNGYLILAKGLAIAYEMAYPDFGDVEVKFTTIVEPKV
jgi:hypothetical protein